MDQTLNLHPGVPLLAHHRSRSSLRRRGKNVSVTDGRQIIRLGQFGLFAFLAKFVLLAFPIFSAAGVLRCTGSTRDDVLPTALVLILAIKISTGFPTPPSLQTWLPGGLAEPSHPPTTRPGCLRLSWLYGHMHQFRVTYTYYVP
jgi:hypothetical protein